jgi:hypothetical protein
MFSGSIHFVTNDRILSFLWLNNIPLCICTIFFIYSSVDGHPSCFHFLVIVNSAMMNVEVWMSLQHTDFTFGGRNVFKSGIAELYGNSILNCFP